MTAQGEFDSTESKIVINLARGDFFATALHEATHYIALNAPAEEYSAFKNEIIRWLITRGTLKQTLDRYAALYADNVPTVDDLTEEVVANAAEALIKSDTFLEKLMLDKSFVRSVSDNKAKSFIKRVMEKLSSLVNALKGYIKSSAVNHSVAEELTEDTAELEKLTDLWTKAFKVASENRAESKVRENTDTESSGVKYSIEETTDGRPVVVVDEDILENVPESEWAKRARHIMKKFVNYIQVYNNMVRVNQKDKNELTGSNRMKTLSKGKTEYNSRVYKDTIRLAGNIDEIMLATTDTINEKPRHGRTDNLIQFARGNVLLRIGQNDYSAEVLFGYTKDNQITFHGVEKLRPTSFILKKDATSLSSQSQNIAIASSADVTSVNNISQSVSNVNAQNLNPQNNSGNVKHSVVEEQTYSDSFKDWFGDWENDAGNASKVVDEEGKPLVVYHGTDAEFTVFNRTKGRSNMDIQGMFFSPYDADSAGYGSRVGAYYLNLRNPADEATAYKALNRFKGQNGAGIKAREFLESLGYDGVFNGYDEYIAFHPEQIKSATDNIGTFDSTNPDIRYSIKEDMSEQERYEELKNKKITLSYPNADKIEDIDLGNYRTLKTRDAKKPIRQIAEKLGINDVDYQNSEIDFVFRFSKSSLDISVNHQQEYGGDYADYVKMLTCIDDLIKNAELIEIHKNYKDNEYLKRTYVLMSAYRDNNYIVPVQFEVKEYDGTQPNSLYLDVVLTKIKESAVVRGEHNSNADISNPLIADSIISLADLFANVNPADKRFLKYVPDDFLNNEQIVAKRVSQEMDYIKHGRYAELFEKKFSIPETEDADYSILAKENEELKVQVESLKHEMTLTKGHKVKREAVRRLANKLRRDYSATMTTEEITDELEKIFKLSGSSYSVL